MVVCSVGDGTLVSITYKAYYERLSLRPCSVENAVTPVYCPCFGVLAVDTVVCCRQGDRKGLGQDGENILYQCVYVELIDATVSARWRDGACKLLLVLHSVCFGGCVYFDGWAEEEKEAFCLLFVVGCWLF